MAKQIFKKKIKALCRVAHVLALGKESLKKNLKKSLPSAGRVDTRQSDRQRNRRRDGRFSLPSVSGALGKAFAECPIKYTRQRVLCRSIFCRVCFAECNIAFAECLRHSAKNLNPVVKPAPKLEVRRPCSYQVWRS